MEGRSLETVIRRPEPELVVVVCRLIGFSVDEADASPLLATVEPRGVEPLSEDNGT